MLGPFALIGKIFKFVSAILWLCIMAIIVAYFGRSYLDTGSIRIPFHEQAAREVAIRPAVSWTAIDREIKDAVKEAHDAALRKAAEDLTGWHSTLMRRVDEDFLPWYFNYFNQQMIGLSYAYHWAYENIVGSTRSPDEQVIGGIQQQFSNRVLRPQISQMEIEQITKDAVTVFVSDLNARLQSIPGKYDMHPEEWDRHLNSIAILASNVEGDRTVPLTLKALTVGATAASAPLVAKAFAPVIKGAAAKMTTMVSAKFMSSAAAATATATGGKVAGAAAGGFLGPIIAVGIIGWDLYDHARTVEENTPIMRENLSDYLTRFSDGLLEPDGSIGGVIHNLEVAIYKGIAQARYQ